MTEFEKRAYYCKMGDIKSMMHMFWHFINDIPDAFYSLNEENFQEIAQNKQSELDEYFLKHKEEMKPAFFWLYRASIYGSKVAQEIQKTLPFSNHADNIYNLRINDLRFEKSAHIVSYSGVSGKTMQKIGLNDFYLDEYYMVTCPFHYFEHGLVELRLDSGCSDADETGFGMSNEYDFYFFNEFYELLTVIEGASVSELSRRFQEIEDKCRVQWLICQKERDDFWEEHKNDSTLERYHQLLAPDFLG